MPIIFVTGSIASGKSTLAKALEQKGAVRIDLDELSRHVLSAGEPVLSEIANKFGQDVLDEAGNLKRALLAERTFPFPEKTKWLEELETPLIRQALRRKLDTIDTSACVVVVELSRPDAMGDDLTLADETIVVLAPYEVRLKRALGRGLSAADFENRNTWQLSDEEFLSFADEAFYNTGEFPELEAYARALMHRYTTPRFRDCDACSKEPKSKGSKGGL